MYWPVGRVGRWSESIQSRASQRTPSRSGAASAREETDWFASSAKGSASAHGTSTKARWAARGCGSVSSGSVEVTPS